MLFDVDETLVHTGGSGARSWRAAFDKLYGIPADIGEHSSAGETDPQGQQPRHHRGEHRPRLQRRHGVELPLLRPDSGLLSPGAGPVGLPAALLGVQRGLVVHVFDRVTDGPKPGLVRDLGATYHTDTLTGSGVRTEVMVECTGA